MKKFDSNIYHRSYQLILASLVGLLFCSIATSASANSATMANIYDSNSSTFIADINNINSQTQQQATDSSSVSNSGNMPTATGFVFTSPRIKSTSSFPYFTIDWSPCFVNEWQVASTGGNSIFDPKIRAYNKTIFLCGGYQGNVTLSAWGQCKLIGLIRVCARFTDPCNHGNNHCCDASNCPAPDPNNRQCPNCKAEAAYRICAFDDPAMPFDLMDNNYNLMPYHQNTPMPPAVTGGDVVIKMGAMLAVAGASIPGLGYSAMAAGAAMMAAGGVMELVKVITSTVNQNVVGNRGCIDVPMAPSPPPFFASVVGSMPKAGYVGICQYSPEYYLNASDQTILLSDGWSQSQINAQQYKQVSTSDGQCEIGGGIAEPPVFSTFENPAIRIFFSNPLTLCNGTSTNIADLCVNGQKIDTPGALATTNKSFLPVCSDSSSTNCINFPSGKIAGSPFRSYYTLTNNSLNPPTTVSSPYVKISPGYTIALTGINDTAYVDLAAGTSATLIDPDERARSFKAIIDNSSNQICALDITDPSADPVTVGCTARPLMMQLPLVSPCATRSSCYYSGQNPALQPRLQVSIGNPAISGIIGVDLALPDPSSDMSPPTNLPPTAFCAQDDIIPGNGNSTSNPSPCYIYAAQFTAYVTDSYNQLPSSTANGTITPINSGGGYTSGLQYVQGSYCRGATQICLSGYDNPNQKVIAKTKKIVYTDASGNTTTQYPVSDDIRDRVIPLYNASTLPFDAARPGKIDPTTVFDPTKNYLTSSNSAPRVAVGFYDTANNLYLENSACNTNDTVCIATSSSYPSAVQCTCRVSSAPPGESCKVQSCDWAFQAAATSSNIDYKGYQDGNYQYIAVDGNGNPAYGQRSLNAVELGLCANMQLPTCAAIPPDQVRDGDDNGNASWPETAVNSATAGTCINRLVGSPSRTCAYKDDGTYMPNGCPNYIITYGPVNNPCAVNYPTWWPSEFLYAHNEFKGAIVNQFNLNPNYMLKITPLAANYTPLMLATNSGGAKIVSYNAPEKWVTTTYDSCKRYANNIDLSKTPRTQTNSDQEMLFISKAGWQDIWSNNDMTWLLTEDNLNNGCYVYNINGKLNASVDSSVIIGLKACKYKSKVSLSLVDLAKNAKTDYTNNAYIMQSNVIAYDQIATASATYATNWDQSYIPQTTVNNQVGSGNSYSINHGIVIDKNGFGSFTAPTINNPSADFVATSIPESITVDYTFTGLYQYKTSKGTYRVYTTFNNGKANVYDQGNKNIVSPAYTVNNCALSVYRKGVSYNSNVGSASYFAMPFVYPPSSAGTYAAYTSPLISSLYIYTGYDGGNRSSPWPYQTWCNMSARIYNYTPGNSAANSSMFLWSTPTNYNVCNN